MRTPRERMLRRRLKRWLPDLQGEDRKAAELALADDEVLGATCSMCNGYAKADGFEVGVITDFLQWLMEHRETVLETIKIVVVLVGLVL